MARLLPLLLVVVLPACTLGSAQEPGDTRYIEGRGVAVIPTAERQPAPEISGETLEGDELSLAEVADGPILVNFWASWCGPCATEAPHLVAILDEYAPQGVGLLGVNVKDRLANARTFQRDFKLNYPSLQDEAGTIAAAFGGIGPAALPTTIILDADRNVAVRLFGAVSAAQLSRHLDDLLAEGGT